MELVMKSLEEIKDHYVRDKFLASHELDTWVVFQNYFASMHPEWFEQHWEKIAKRYATEYAKEALKNASDLIPNDFYLTEDQWEIIKGILSETNLPKHD